MAKKKAVGSLKNGRDSKSKRLGLKKHEGNKVYPGVILIRQRGMKFNPGINVRIGRDFTLYSISKGLLKFKKIKNKTLVNVL
ncbi:50S ribosomal protein L27 [Candidatus Vidania fulgoroideorum]